MLTNERTTTKLSSYLRSLASRRSDGTVTADDVHRFLDKNTNLTEEHTRIRTAYVNTVLREPLFKPVGFTVSKRPIAKSRQILEWAY